MSTPSAPSTKEELENLVNVLKVEENSSLEYKAAGEIDRQRPSLRDDMTKDVSAFANAAGGVLIYGVQEYGAKDKRHLPEKITPIDARKYSREWFDQMLGQIQPRIEGLEIRPIQVGPGAADFAFVVAIPQSATAHQATDLKYYRRRNFETTAMEDYEIRDVMNRQKHPRLSVLMKILRDETTVLFNVKNESPVMATHYQIVADFPIRIGAGLEIRFTNAGLGSVALIGDNVHGNYWRVVFSSPISTPLFPQSVYQFRADFNWLKSIQGPQRDMKAAVVTAFADSMPPMEFKKEVEAALKDWV